MSSKPLSGSSRGVRVMQHVAGAAVKQSLVPAARTGKQFPFLDQRHPEPAQG